MWKVSKVAEIYLLSNTAIPNAAPNAGVVTSATLFTLLQVKLGSTLLTPRAKVVEWGVSFNATSAIAPFSCDLIACATAATVTAFATTDIINYDPLGITSTSGFPFTWSTITSGFTSTTETAPTSTRVFDPQLVAPTTGYFKQFPLGREPGFQVSEYLRLRVKGDGATKCTCYVVIEI
jgi:hypothetical protein